MVGETNVPEPVEDLDCPTAAEFKTLGNASYKRGDVAEAVDFWGRALRAFVENGESHDLTLGSMEFEQSLYLNLAQGHLKLGEAEKAMKACHVVLQDAPTNEKALYRLAEATMMRNDLKAAADWLGKLLDASPGHVAGTQLLRKVRDERKSIAEQEKKTAAKMFAGAAGCGDGRDNGKELGEKDTKFMDNFRSENIESRLDISEAAAKAARERSGRGPSLPSPAPVDDLDAFHAKIKARTNKMNAYVKNSKQNSAAAKKSVTLAWLRQGLAKGSELDEFQAKEMDELRTLEVRDLAEAMNAHRENHEPELEEQECLHAGSVGAGMETMD